MSNDNLLSRSDEKQKGLRLREFEWFEVETKVRKFVFELLDPNMKKLIKDRQKVDGFEDLLEQLQVKIKQFDENLLQNEQRMKLFDEAAQKLNTLSQDLGKVKIDIKAKGDDINKVDQQSEVKLSHLKGEISQQSIQIESTIMNMEEQIKQMDKFKQETISSVDNQAQKQTSLKEEFKSYKTDQNEIQKQMQDQINLLKSLLGQKEIYINQNTESINQLQRRMLQNENDIFNLNKKLEDLPIIQQRVQQIQRQIDKQQQDITTLSQYIDLNIPLNTYTQITECLYSCMSNDAQKRLVDFDERQYKILNTRIQKQEPGELKEENNNNHSSSYQKQNLPPLVDFSQLNNFFSEKMSNVVKRNKKYKKISSNKERVMKHLRQEDKQQQQQQINDQISPNIYSQGNNELYQGEKDMIMQQTLEALDNYNNNQLLQPNNQQLLNHYITNTQNTLPQSSNQISTQNSRRDQRGVQERFSKSGGVSQAQNNDDEILSVEEIIAKELSSPQFYHRLEQQVKQYANKFEIQQQQFQDQIKKQLEDKEELYQIQYDKCFEMIEVEQDKVNNMKLRISSTIDAQNESLNTIQSCLQLIQQANLIFESNIIHLNQFSTILTHLTLQDEKDKNSIGLYGFRESPIDQNSGTIHSFNQQDTLKANQSPQKGLMNNVQLEEKCLSCSGQSIQINQLFKLACLAYKPQPIQLEGKQYSRIDLLQLCQKILTNISQLSLNKRSPKKLNKKILRSSFMAEDDKESNKQQIINDSQMQETSRSFNEPSTNRGGTLNTLNQTIEQGFSTHRASLSNQSNHNLEHEITLLNNTYTAREQNQSTNYYQITEQNPRQQLKSRQLSNSTRDWSLQHEDKLKRFPSLDSGQIQLSNINLAQLSTNQMKVITKHKVRKLVQNKQNQPNQRSDDLQQLNKTSISFATNLQHNKEKVNTFEKRRQVIMKQSISSLNNSSIIN